MTMTIDAEVDDRRGRIFVTELPTPATLVELRHHFAEHFIEPDDTRRIARLEKTIRQPVVTAAVHPGIDPDDIVQVFLQTGEADHPRVFACTIVPESRLALMLHETPVVFENFNLQVALGPFLKAAAMRSALESWASRNFPGIPVPAFELSLWADEEALKLLPVLNLAVRRSDPTVGGPLPRTFQPDPNIVRPAYKKEAA